MTISNSTPSVACTHSSGAHTNINTNTLNHPVLRCPVLKHIPKSACPSCCAALAGILPNISANRQDQARWGKLFSFCPSTLLIPPKDGSRSNVSDIIKQRVSGSLGSTDPAQNFIATKRRTFDLARAVSSRIEDSNVKAAFRLVSSDDKPPDCSDAALTAMLARHPSAPSDRALISDPGSHSPLRFSEVEVLKAIKSFPAGSSGGPDGFRPQHLLELVTCQSNGPALLTAVTDFVNLVLEGGCPASVSPVFFGARLIALEKKAGGFRPIAIGYTFRRLISKCANTFAQKKLADYFSAIQLGVAVSGG